MSVPLNRKQFNEAVQLMATKLHAGDVVNTSPAAMFDSCWEVYRAALAEALTIVKNEVAEGSHISIADDAIGGSK